MCKDRIPDRFLTAGRIVLRRTMSDYEKEKSLLFQSFGSNRLFLFVKKQYITVDNSNKLLYTVNNKGGME